LTDVLNRFGEVTTVPDSQSVWRAIRDVLPFATARTGAEAPLWRVSTVPALGARLMQMIAADPANGGATGFYDWAGGLVWLSLGNADQDAGAAAVRRAVATCGGHATLVRAPASLRAAVDPFQPEDDGLAALTKRVKQGFDPSGIFNPGRMWVGV
jgi:glycolate oxidase FAD binding subunit